MRYLNLECLRPKHPKVPIELQGSWQNTINIDFDSFIFVYNNIACWIKQE